MDRTRRAWSRKAGIGTGFWLFLIVGSLQLSCGSAQTGPRRCVQVHFVTASDHVDVTEEGKLASEPPVGDTEASATVPATAPSDAEMVASGRSHTCALMRDRGVKCWGDNTYGQLGDGTTQDSSFPVQVVGLRETVIEVSCGDFHTCARTESGAVLCWGRNEHGQLGVGTYDHSLQPLTVLWDKKVPPPEKKKSRTFPRKLFRKRRQPAEKSKEVHTPRSSRNESPKRKGGRDTQFSVDFDGPEDNPLKQSSE